MKKEEFLKKWGGSPSLEADLDRVLGAAKDRGIALAAEVARDYDNYSSHGFLVSDCILAKLNVRKGKPRRNPAARQLRQLLDGIERRLDSVEARTRFMAGVARWEKGKKEIKAGRKAIAERTLVSG